MLEELLGEAPPGLERSDVLLELAISQARGSRASIELCDAALADAEGDDTRSARILALRAGTRLLETDAVGALADARAAVDKAELGSDPRVLAVSIAYAGQAETYHAEVTPGLLERGVEIEERLGLELDWNYSPTYVLGRRSIRFGETDRARAIFERVESRSASRGDEITRVMALWSLTLFEWLAGHWSVALERANAAYELTEQTQHAHARHWVGRAKALLEADLALVEEARASAGQILTLADEMAYEVFVIETLGVLGRLELELGNTQTAADHMRELPGRLLAGGMNDPAGHVWPDAVEALIAVGELERARSYLDAYETHAERLGSPYARAGAARCRGLLLAADGDAPGALAAFERSLADAAAFPLERGRTQLCLGMVQRRAQQRKAARDALEQALAIFEELGARLWAEKARAELRRISGRAPASEELTETERRAAELAAQGRTNKALANAAGDETREARILGFRGWIRVFQADIDGALVDTRAALERAERIGDPALIAATIGQVATAEGRAGDFTPGLVERGVEIEQRLALELQYNESPSVSLSRRLAGQGDMDRARTILEEIGARATARGDERLRAQARGALARIEWFAGNLQLALHLAAEAHERHDRIQHEVGLTVRLRALAEADLGLGEQARASAEEALTTSEEMSDREWALLSAGVLGRLEFALGDLDAALGYVRELPGELLSKGYKDPTAPVWGDAIEILIASGEREQASGYLLQYELNSSRAGSPWAVAVASRCRGLLAFAEDDLASAVAAFERSLTVLEELPYPLERGRTLLALGTVRRQAQQRKAAREALEQALTIFSELGARLWADKAHAELRRISGRRTSSDELTETEQRVAELAADGRTNKEIASELFMGVSTVEAHLSRIYRKLGLRSRTELAGRITARDASVKLVDEGAQV
jgi:DNA-binding NarL/FixJ family response regulator